MRRDADPADSGAPYQGRWSGRIDGLRDAEAVHQALAEAERTADAQDGRRCADVHFLLDECVTPLLEPVANAFGYRATFIHHRGWSTLKDHVLYHRLIEETLILVTNNRADWLALLGNTELHPGLVVIQENVPRARQMHYFTKCLVAIGALPSMINMVVEVDADSAVYVYAMPPV